MLPGGFAAEDSDDSIWQGARVGARRVARTCRCRSNSVTRDGAEQYSVTTSSCSVADRSVWNEKPGELYGFKRQPFTIMWLSSFVFIRCPPPPLLFHTSLKHYLESNNIPNKTKQKTSLFHATLLLLGMSFFLKSKTRWHSFHTSLKLGNSKDRREITVTLATEWKWFCFQCPEQQGLVTRENRSWEHSPVTSGEHRSQVTVMQILLEARF